jgi:hypothetical protein
MRFTALLLISVLLAGCTPALITKQDYDKKCQEVAKLQNTLTGSVYYQGTRDGYDYFRFEPFGSRSHRARVKEGEVFLKKRFPYTTEKKNWFISYPDWSGSTGLVNLATLMHSSLLETGRTYSANVKQDTASNGIAWMVQNPPIPNHYAVGFQWLNLSKLNNPRDGVWTFVVKDIERWHDASRGGPMGTFIASYKCEVVAIEDAQK